MAATSAIAVAATLLVGACTTDSATPPATTAARPGPSPVAAGGPRPFAEPVRLSARDGVLEVRLHAHQSTISLDTVATPVDDALVFGYEVVQGSSSGAPAADRTYPAPTLHVDPGEKLVVHLENALMNLTIPDFYDPAFTKAGQPVPLYPPALTSAPLNLHTHGLHVSPKGNSDNVLLDIPPGKANTYTYDIPKDHPQGLYWYHSHRHTLTAQQTYAGLAGLIEIGRPDGDIPVVTDQQLPVRTMILQYNDVFGRKDGLHKLNDVNWPQYVSTLQEPTGSQLADGTYSPTLTPVNFGQSPVGATYFTNWWTGPLSVNNNRGQFQFIPSNLQSFSSVGGAPTVATDPVAPTQPPGSTAGAPASVSIPVDPKLPDDQRDVQFTVNGQFQPVIEAKPGQTEVWVLGNASDFAYMNVTLTETATGNHPTIAVLGQDGNPYEQVHNPTTNGGTTLLIPPGSRYVIAVTMPPAGDVVLEMPPLPGGTPMTNEGILYTNDGDGKPSATLGTVTVPPSSISYVDGFFATPTQVLLRARSTGGTGTTQPFAAGQPLGAYTSFVDTAAVAPAVTRSLVVSGGFTNDDASTDDPKAFVYQFDDTAFPWVPLLQPRLDSVEQWTITNQNNDEHPIHIHVNDFQLSQIVDPTVGTTTGVQPWGQDNVNLPAPSMDAAGNVVTPGSLTLSQRFTQYTGTYVIHCHRLNHEDNGLMAIINVIPAVSTYAVAVPGAGGAATTAEVRNQADNSVLATATPFAGYTGPIELAVGDVNGDQILDLVAAPGAGGPPQVVALSGAPDAQGRTYTTELARFDAFASDQRGGVHVATAGIDGNALADNIIVGSGAGAESQVKVYASALPPVGTAPAEFSVFDPYPGSRAGVEVAAGMVDATSGRNSIVTAPGPGSPTKVKVSRFDLYTDIGAAPTRDHQPTTVAELEPFGTDYTGGVSLATGWLAGGLGGAQRIVIAQRGAPGLVTVYSSGSLLDGGPELYTTSPDHHGAHVAFTEMLRFTPFPGSSTGVRVATTSTAVGADLLVSGPSAEIGRYEVARPSAAATSVEPRPVATIPAGGTGPVTLAGA